LSLDHDSETRNSSKSAVVIAAVTFVLVIGMAVVFLNHSKNSETNAGTDSAAAPIAMVNAPLDGSSTPDAAATSGSDPGIGGS
jgi:hypothetical protein